MKILLGEKENKYNPSSSDNITKKVIFVNFVELQLFYANFEMKSIQLWSCIHPQKLCSALYQKRTRPVLSIYVYHLIGSLLYPFLQITLLYRGCSIFYPLITPKAINSTLSKNQKQNEENI